MPGRNSRGRPIAWATGLRPAVGCRAGGRAVRAHTGALAPSPLRPRRAATRPLLRQRPGGLDFHRDIRVRAHARRVRAPIFVFTDSECDFTLKIAAMRAAASLTAWIALSMVRDSGCAREFAPHHTTTFRRVEPLPTKKKGGRK